MVAPYHKKYEIEFYGSDFCLDTIKFSFTRGILFPSHYFHTFCPYLESLTCFHGKYLIVQTFYVHLKDKGKDQESIQSRTTPDPGYKSESDKLTVGHHKREHLVLQLVHIYINSTC